ncbi:hypothetical protein HYW84_04460 [Candidatus Peregrinibacteria bacterium]|nr:hypothetical protein [Candidatus Peregrinibacteria bacterium]
MRKWCVGIGLVVFVGAGVCFLLFDADWRHPYGPDGDVRVRYTIPVQGKWMDGERREGDTTFSFSIAGYVERVQLVPTSGHNENGFVMLYIKTTGEWYQTPTGSLGGPVDWDRGVKVEFIYPDGMKLRDRTRLPINSFYPVFAFRWDDILLDSLRWRGHQFSLGDDLDKGDIASVHFCHLDGGQKVKVCRTTGFKSRGYHIWGADDGLAVEVTVSDK